MKYFLVSIALFVSCLAAASTPRQPIASGQYTFRHKFAEHPSIPSISVTVKINGRRIVVINESPPAVFPKGILASGTLMWHPGSQQWIIGHKKSDASLRDVGGCSDGPEVVDLQKKIYWTC